MKRKTKKAQAGLPSFVMSIVLIGVVVGVGLLVLSEFEESTAVQSVTAAGTAVNTTISAAGGISDWLSIIVIVVIASVIIGLFGMRGFGRGAA